MLWFSPVRHYAGSFLPSHSLSVLAITASSSTGFNEHVEYTTRPSVASSSIPRFKIRFCILCKMINKSINHK